MVFAAASLADVVRATLGNGAAVQAAATSTLARQVDAGARADLFVSADRVWIDWLAERGRLVPESIAALASNALVAVAPASLGPGGPPLLWPREWAEAFEGRIAVGDPEHVPAGRYARAALETLGLWELLAPRLVPAANVRVALAYAERGEVDLALVYRTDAVAAGASVRVVASVPDHAAPPIRSYVARIASRDAARSDGIDALQQQLLRAAATSWSGYGFGPVD